MRHKGYTALITNDADDKAFHGRVAGIRGTVHLEAADADGLEAAFRESVDEYLDFCAAQGRPAERPIPGRLQLKLASDTHRKASAVAAASGMSLNAWLNRVIEEACERALDEPDPVR